VTIKEVYTKENILFIYWYRFRINKYNARGVFQVFAVTMTMTKIARNLNNNFLIEKGNQELF
jgi:hypothetical protein